MTVAAFRVIEWVPYGMAPEAAAEPIVRAMVAQGAGWHCVSLLRSGECRDSRSVLVVRGWHEKPAREPAEPTWEDVFPRADRVSRDDALRVLEREMQRRGGVIAALGRVLKNTEAEERDLAALRAAYSRLLVVP